MLITREPTLDDLPEILQLTRDKRTMLAELEPHFWRKSENADDLHDAFVTFQVNSRNVITRVLEIDGRVSGYAVSTAHPSGFFLVDDICLSSELDWMNEGIALLTAIDERPAITTLPHGERRCMQAALEVGLECINTVRFHRFDQEQLPDDAGKNLHTIAPPTPFATSPTHVWLPAMTPDAITVLGDGNNGYVVLSPPVSPPPIYDAGGKPCVIDRVVGDDGRALLQGAFAFAQKRGDVGVILVIDAADTELAAIADDLGARHPVDTMQWPGSAG